LKKKYFEKHANKQCYFIELRFDDEIRNISSARTYKLISETKVQEICLWEYPDYEEAL